MFNFEALMNSRLVKYKKLHPDAHTPKYATDDSAGADLYACISEDNVILPHETKLIPTGLAAAIPHGCVGLIFARSGLATKQGLAPANKVGVIDSDYRGEIMVALHNHDQVARIVHPNDRIAQLVVMPYTICVYQEADELDETDRGAGGFGSTGVN